MKYLSRFTLALTFLVALVLGSYNSTEAKTKHGNFVEKLIKQEVPTVATSVNIANDYVAMPSTVNEPVFSFSINVKKEIFGNLINTRQYGGGHIYSYLPRLRYKSLKLNYPSTANKHYVSCTCSVYRC